jgi:hypothetical protein
MYKDIKKHKGNNRWIVSNGSLIIIGYLDIDLNPNHVREYTKNIYRDITMSS